MGLRSLFRRKTAAGDTAGSTAVVEPQAEVPLTLGEPAELQQAWAEHAEAAKGSGVNRPSRLYPPASPGKDPAAVRSMAALLRHVRDEDTAPGIEPAG